MGRRRFVARSSIDCTPDELYAWHLRPGAFERLVPPWAPVRVLERSGPLEEGARVVLQVPAGPLRMRWVAIHRGFDGRSFQDVAESGPFSHWVHTHRMLDGPSGGAVLEDAIEYDLPLAGRWLAGGFVRKQLARQFDYRHGITAADLSRHGRVADRPRLSVAVTGAGGLVGSALCAFLETGGHRVLRLVRRDVAPDAQEIFWNPAEGAIDAEALEGVDAIVHLAGENIAAGRWTPARKASIAASRVAGTGLIAGAVARLRRPPKVVIGASAVGFYGNRGDEEVDETSRAGTGFLPETCRRWEDAWEPAERAGLRVVRLRIGVVLSAAGGALPRMLTPFRFGLGGRIGSGRQFMSWVSADDLIGIVHHALFDDRLSGAVNAVAPSPVDNAAFTRTLGAVLGRPTPFPVPATAIRMLLGELGQALVLDGARVMPRQLERVGFEFRHETLEPALRFELGRGNSRPERPAMVFE